MPTDKHIVKRNTTALVNMITIVYTLSNYVLSRIYKILHNVTLPLMPARQVGIFQTMEEIRDKRKIYVIQTKRQMLATAKLSAILYFK